MFVLSLLVGVVGVTAAFQHNWWENRWSNSDGDTLGEGKAQFRHNIGESHGQWTGGNSIVGGAHFNQIDFRYPDWVVSPRPPCVQEGVFPHPRSSDCTWYYRCVARVGVPIYATFYFHCEPGTMFDDDLDQCVHPHSGSTCQGSVTPAPPPPPQNVCRHLESSCGNYKVCRGGTQRLCRKETCTLTGVKDFCNFGQLKDMNTGRCVDIPAPCPTEPPTTTRPIDTGCVAIDCKSVEVCTGSNRDTQRVCENERCTREGQDIGVRRMCGERNNQVYDQDQRKCVPPPSENTCNCEFTKTNCREYDLCNPSGVRRLCDCDTCGSRMLYDPAARQCVDKSILCPTLDCVFRDSDCSCLQTRETLCTGCYMRGNFIKVEQFCKAQSSPKYYHVEEDTCLYSDPGFYRATSGHCPRLRDSAYDPAIQCSLRNNVLLRCWSDDMNVDVKLRGNNFEFLGASSAVIAA